MTMNPIPDTANGLVFFRSVQQKLEYFYSRWQDEKEYEDFGDYQAEAVKLCANGGVKFEKLTRSPFALTFVSLVDNHRYVAKITARYVSITRKPI